MPSEPPFISYARNREDVVLWRALGHLGSGRYVEVGADPHDSVSRALDDRGWSGSTVAPGPQLALADVLRADGGPDRTVHVLRVAADGAEGDVLAGVDLTAVRPWVLVVRSTAGDPARQTHAGWEPDVLAAGYRFCLFDGVSRFYVADEHAELQAALSFPACALDRFEDSRVDRALREREDLIEETLRWKASALRRWSQATARPVSVEPSQEAERLRAEIDAIHATLSWRVTWPLRAVRKLIPR